MKTTPKILGTPIWDDHSPPSVIWMARLRNPYVLAGFDLGAGHTWLWPLVVDASPQRREKIHGSMIGLLLMELDIPLPELTEIPPPDPPEFLHLMDWRNDNEWILEPHAPRLWRMRINADDDCEAITWWREFGIPPEFPRDTRRVADFHDSPAFDSQTDPAP